MLFPSVATLLCFAYVILGSAHEGIDFHVDSILGEMSAEDDAYGIEPQQTLKKLTSNADVDDFVKVAGEDKPVVVGYFDLPTCAEEFDIFETLGERDAEDYNYGYVTNKDVLVEKKLASSAVVVYLPTRSFNPEDDQRKARYPNKTITSIVHLKKFIRRHAVPLVGEMTPTNEKLYRNTRLSVVTAFMHIDHTKRPNKYAYVRNRLRNVARQWRGRMSFNIANTNDYIREINQLYEFEGADDSKSKNAIMVGLRDGSVYYPMEGEFSGGKLKEFVEDFVAGRLEGNEQFDDYLNKDEDDALPP